MNKVPGTQLITRTFNIIRLFNNSRQNISLSEISKDTGLHPSTAYRILQSLIAEGLMIQDSQTEKYSLGYGLISIGETAKNSASPLKIIRPYEEKLHKLTNEYVTVDTLNHDLWVVDTIDYIETETYRIKVQSSRGMLLPAHCAATGKVQLAFLSKEQIDLVIRRELKELTPFSITDPEVFREHLEKIRKQGYAISNEELELGYISIAAPFFDHNNKIVAAISVGAPKVRFTEERVQSLIDPILSIANHMSGDLGYRGNLLEIG